MLRYYWCTEYVPECIHRTSNANLGRSTEPGPATAHILVDR